MNKKNYGKGNKNFNKSAGRIEAKKILIENIDLNSKGSVFVTGVVNRVVQTGGPTIFVVNDGTGSLSLKGFIGPGLRAYPEIKEDDAVKAVVSINEYQGELEGEISSIKKLPENEKKLAEKRENPPETTDSL